MWTSNNEMENNGKANVKAENCRKTFKFFELFEVLVFCSVKVHKKENRF